MLIHVEISARLDLQVERAVARDELEHVVEKPYAGRDAVLSVPVERDPDAHMGFGRSAVDYRAPHSVSSIVSATR
jgi:hypothetical protein